MKKQPTLPYKGDPSDAIQSFTPYNLNLLCCRYWWLKRWEFRELAFPYWRVYYNNCEGAYIETHDQTYALSPDKLYLIAPNTSYSTHLYEHHIPSKGFALQGNHITTDYLSNAQSHIKSIRHLFIHFNIGIPYDNISPGIFIIDLTPHIEEKINIITNHLIQNHKQFNFHSTLAIHSLIGDILNALDESNWELKANDNRIIEVLGHIENQITSNLSNEQLADYCQLSTNAFIRLFKEELGISPQHYVRQKRIDKACVLLHHSEKSIEDIAFQTGFANRYHFSRIFAQVTGLSPAKYRNEFKIV